MYFGTLAVTNDLMKMPGWDKGHVTIDNSCIVRDSGTGNVIQISGVNETNYNSDFDSDDGDDIAAVNALP